METPISPAPIGPLYHGTRKESAKAILRNGFRRSRSKSHTGTGICLTEALSLAYEYGSYETGGCVLEVWLSGASRWTETAGHATLENPVDRNAYDDFFQTSGLDAVRAFGGNVWVVWNPQIVVARRRLSHADALRLLCAAFDRDGPDCAYNGVVADCAAVWWGHAEHDPNLRRFPAYRRRIMRALLRAVGRTQSTQGLPFKGAPAR